MDAHQSWLEKPYDDEAADDAKWEAAYDEAYDETEATINVFDFENAELSDIEEIESLIGRKANNEMLGAALRKLIQNAAKQVATKAADAARDNGYQ
jgi:hypothetical protein